VKKNHAAQAPFNPENLTHIALLAVVEKAIASLPAYEAWFGRCLQRQLAT